MKPSRNKYINTRISENNHHIAPQNMKQKAKLIIATIQNLIKGRNSTDKSNLWTTDA